MSSKVTSSAGNDYQLDDGAVVIAAITSCTNTSNPSVMIGAGLVAKKSRGLRFNGEAWVKTSLAPGSLVVRDYLEKANLIESLNKLGFNIVGYGCTTCIGNSGPLPVEVSKGISEGKLVAASVLSGNRNFEGSRTLGSKNEFSGLPPLVVAYAIAGTMDIDIQNDPLGQDSQGKDVFLKDIWPSQQEINDIRSSTINSAIFRSNYENVFAGDTRWAGIQTPESERYPWNDGSTYIQNPPYFEGMGMEAEGFDRSGLPGYW